MKKNELDNTEGDVPVLKMAEDNAQKNTQEVPWFMSEEEWKSGDYVEIAHELYMLPAMNTMRAASQVLFTYLVLQSRAEKTFTLPRKFYREIGFKKITLDQSLRQLINRRFIIAKKEKDTYEFSDETMRYIRKGVPHSESED